MHLALIGIDFLGRNYAMGGTASATMMSMCHKEIFRQDFDFFIILLFSLHLPGRHEPEPTRCDVDPLQRTKRPRSVQILEKAGLVAFIQDDKVEKEMKVQLPDSAGISMEELTALPELTRNYKCGISYEKGESFCGTEKFSK
jgi:hypothetical protein